MKKSILTLIVILISATLSFSQTETSIDPEPGSRLYLDYKNGFKEIKLGSDISDISTKVKLLDKENQYYDYLNAAGLKIGTADIKTITIVAFNGKVKDIFISLEKGTGNTIYSVLREAYGMYSDKPNRFMDKYYWNGSKVRLIFDFTSEYKMPNVWFSDVKVSEEYYKASKEKDKKAINDL